MSSESEPAADLSALASLSVVDDLRKLGLTAGWSAGFQPTYGDLIAIKWPRLNALYERVDCRAVNDSTLEVLRFAPGVTALELSSTCITDGGMAALRYVPLLESVDLTNTRVSDLGIRHLLQHRHLKHFTAMSARVTVVGERLVRDSIPGCDASIGRTSWRGQVLSLDANIMTVEDHNGDIWSVVVPESKFAEFVTEFATPLGRTVFFLKGEPPEPNPFRHFAREGYA